MRRDRVGWVAVTAAMAWVLCATGDPVPIPNDGFENRAAEFLDGQDKYPQFALDIWRHFEVDNNGGPLRVWNPGVPGTARPGFGGDAPEGSMVMLVRTRYNDDEFYDPPRPRDFEAAAQLLTTPFNPATNYILRAAVGRTLSDLWNGYKVQLVAGGSNVDGARYAGRVQGGTVIAADTNSLMIDGGTFVTSTVVYTPNAALANLAGQPLQIRLCALEDPANHASVSHAVFDDVSLETAAKPPPPPPPAGSVLIVR